jgi:hypothetical protein
MNRRKNKKITYLLLLLLGLSIGFAALATTLKINGTANIGKNTWDVYWDRIANQSGVTPDENYPKITADENNVPKSLLTWSVTLDKPGDFYEFTVDAVNAGTIDAEITEIISKYGNTVIPDVIDQEHPSPVPSYIKYSVVYADNNEKPAVGEKLLKASDPTDENTFTRKTYKIRVEYDKDAVTNSIINEMDEEGETHTFSFEVKYGQATSSDDDDPIAAIMREIEADPDSHRNPQQNVANRDIGLDENGNVIDLDWWTNYDVSDDYSHLSYTRDYSKRVVVDAETEEMYEISDEMVLGISPCGTTCTNSGVYTIATASENIVNGEMIAPIPAYIMMVEDGEFHPVREIAYAFGDYDESGKVHMTKFPHIPNTVTRLGFGMFWELKSLTNVEIPKNVKYIDTYAFSSAFDFEGANNTLTFEEGSQLEFIGDASFDTNSLTGDLVLPSTVKYIGHTAFRYNYLNSVSFPTSAQYFTGYQDPDEDSFDSGVEINLR